MKIAVGLSGGIDSTVSLLRLKEEGHHVTAVFLNIYQRENTRKNLLLCGQPVTSQTCRYEPRRPFEVGI